MKIAKSTALALLSWACLTAAAQATAIRLLPDPTNVSLGNAFDVRIVADIDPADAIIGFGFDLDASPGIVLQGFSSGPGFADDPVFLAPYSDADGIRGASGGDLLGGPAISGLDILLGTLHLGATQLGPASIGLSADDLSFSFTEGLIPLSASLGNFMPAVTLAQVDVASGNGNSGTVAEPGSLACMLAAMLAMSACRPSFMRRRSR